MQVRAYDDAGAYPELAGLADAEAFRLTPATLAVEATGGRWKPALHLLYMASKMAAAIVKGNARVLLSAPSRHGKSKLLTVHTAAWYLDRWPERNVMLAAYGADLAHFHARETRDLIMSRPDIYRCEVRRDAHQVDHWQTTAGGGMVSGGIGGPFIGKGGHLMLVDDYFKNMKEADSESKKAELFDWFGSTFLSRMEEDASIIVLATRWGPDDLIGRLLAEQPDVWEYVCLPAVADHDPAKGEVDPIGRNPGEALWPEKRNEKVWAAFRKLVTTYVWQAMWQQKPISRFGLAKGGIIFVDIVPIAQRLTFCRYWDLAASENSGDYSCGLLMAKDNLTELSYILEIDRDRKSPGDLEKWIHTVAARDEGAYGGVKIGIEQEPGGGGKIAAHHIANNILKGFVTEVFPVASESKPVRAQPFLAAVENSFICAKRAEWNDKFKNELNTFPGGANDDMVDAAAGAYNMLHGKRLRAGTFGRELSQVSKIYEPQKQLYVPGVAKSKVVWGRRR
jgi:predicted phage terminase large subunit-like protein